MRLLAVPWPIDSNSEEGRVVIWLTTTAVVSELSGGGGAGVVYQRMTRNAATSSAMPATTAAGATHAGVPATGLRMGALRPDDACLRTGASWRLALTSFPG